MPTRSGSISPNGGSQSDPFREPSGGTKSRWYFAYGSNMNPARVRERGLEYSYVLPAALDDHTLLFNKLANSASPERVNSPERAGHANIEPASGQIVEGVAYQLADDDHIARMDPFERVPVNYRRELVLLRTAHGPITAWTYFANPAVIAPNLLPKPAYLAHLLVGLPFVSAPYAKRLQQQATWTEKPLNSSASPRNAR